MTWAHDAGDTISLACQQKTDARVEVAVHSVLKAALDEAKRHTRGIPIIQVPDQVPDGQPWARG